MENGNDCAKYKLAVYVLTKVAYTKATSISIIFLKGILHNVSNKEYFTNDTKQNESLYIYEDLSIRDVFQQMYRCFMIHILVMLRGVFYDRTFKYFNV